MGSEGGVIAVVGPTACGKSEFAIGLAQRLGAEIVSVDSVQVYKGLDVGTSKPPRQWRDAVPHHMIDLLEPWEPTSAGWYRQEARKCIEEIIGRGRPVVLVGGSSLYYFAITTELPLFPPSRRLREKLEERVAAEGLGVILGELSSKAPAVLASIDSRNPRRVIRALEIAEERRSRGESQDGWYRGIEHYCQRGWDLVAIGLSMPKHAHRHQIERRVGRMIAGGLVEEVQRVFADAERPPAPSVASAVGYRQVYQCLKERAGEERIADAVVSATWRLARRQRAWFRRDPRVCWFSSENPEVTFEAASSFVLRALEARSRFSHGVGPSRLTAKTARA